MIYALDHQENRRNQTPWQKALTILKRDDLVQKIQAAAKERMLSGKKQDPAADRQEGRSVSSDPVEPQENGGKKENQEAQTQSQIAFDAVQSDTQKELTQSAKTESEPSPEAIRLSVSLP